MLANEVITLGAAIFGLLTSIAGSTACFYNSYKTSRINLSILKVKVQNLEILIQELQQKLNGIDVLKHDPREWISRAREFLETVNISDLESRLNENCVGGQLPNFCSRFGALKSIEESNHGLDVLLDSGKNVSREIKVKGSIQPEVNIVGNARKEIKKRIWEQVSQAETAGIVCIHGMTGVGKTAFAAAIHNKALKELTAFENVIWVNVENGSGLKHIQEELASKLQVHLPGTTVNKETLRSALMQRGRFLLVLDSMWQAFSLHDIGIPEPVAGSKLIVTSKTYSVCRKITKNIKSREIYEIKPLLEAEAWDLFQGEVGPNIVNLESETVSIAQRAVKNLDGLPLAIKLFAETLSEVHDDYGSGIDAAWKDELFSLSRSTSLLEGYLIKPKELIDYWMWEGLLGPISSLGESMRLGRQTLNELKFAHLLESVKSESGEESLKMINLVRHVAMDAISKSGNHFFIKCGQSLGEFPSAYDWPANTERASLVQNQLRALQNSPDCNKLSTLLLQDNPLNLVHHENFFSKIRNLRVLDLSRTSISSLPKSFSGLTNLHALLLRSCRNLKLLPSLSNLHRLIVIDISETPLEQVPDGLHNLINLRRLDLSKTKIEVFPATVLGKLTEMEELLLITAENGGYVWGSNLIFPQWPGACIEELLDLKKMVVLQLAFLNPEVFNRFVDQVDDQQRAIQLRSFKFYVGGIYSGGDIGDNSVVVMGDCSIRVPRGTSELYLMKHSQELLSLKFDGCMRDLTIVDVSRFDALTYLFTLEMLGSLKSLKKICVKHCKKMKSVIQPAAEANPTSITIPKLTNFKLYDLQNLESIYDGKVLSCPSLHGFEVFNCKKLKLPKVLVGRQNCIIEIVGEKEWIDKVMEDGPSPHLKYTEALVPAELSTPSFRLRRSESFVSFRDTHEDSGRSLGATIPRWHRLFHPFRGSAVFSPAADTLHIASTTSNDAISEVSVLPHAEAGTSQRGFNRTRSSRSD
ncbi:hypothetical protein SOVF_033550 [Spinacia oleracea]|nr:hypothetical protein SOVF_033550 [Spinacia oleracea]